MSVIYHNKRSDALIIDWSVLQSDKLNYVSLLSSHIDNKRDIISVPFSPVVSPYQTIKKICRQFGIRTLVLLNLFDYVGQRRAKIIIERLHNVVDSTYRICLGGVTETVCSDLFKESKTRGVCVLKTLEQLDNESTDINTRCIPIGNHVSNEIDSDQVFTSIFESINRVDRIELLLSTQEQTGQHRWCPEWMEVIDTNSTGDFIINTIEKHIQRLDCNSIMLTGCIFGSSIWPNKSAFISWLISLNQRNPILNIVLSTPPLSFDKAFANELHQCGVTQYELQLSPSCTLPSQKDLIYRMVDICIESGITPAYNGNLITEKSSWIDVRNAWNMCDRIGGDFIEMLGTIPHIGENGWCGDLCRLLSRTSLLFEYRRAVKHIKIAEQHPELYNHQHSSITDFHRAKLDQTRNLILGKISNYGISNFNDKTIEYIAQKVATELTNISETLISMTSTDKGGVNTSEKLTTKVDSPNVAIIVTTENNESMLHLCLSSIYLYTNHPYDLFVIDCGTMPSHCSDIQCRGRFSYEHIPRKRLRSFSVASGLLKAWSYDYILILSANACVIADGWLDDMLNDLNTNPKIGAVGLCLGRLDYKKNKNEEVAHLHKFVLSADWQRELGYNPYATNDDLMRLLTKEGTSCFMELDGRVQMYKGNILRRIGLPIVQDSILKHKYWDSELSMRVICCGYDIKDSQAAWEKTIHFGEMSFSRIPGISFHEEFIKNNRKQLIKKGQETLARLLDDYNSKNNIVTPYYYDWYGNKTKDVKNCEKLCV